MSRLIAIFCLAVSFLGACRDKEIIVAEDPTSTTDLSSQESSTDDPVTMPIGEAPAPWDSVVVVSPSQQPGPNGEPPLNPIEVEDFKQLPKCTAGNEKLEVFVGMMGCVFVCHDGDFYQKKD